MPSSSIKSENLDKKQAVKDITKTVKDVALEIAKKEIKTKQVTYGIQYRNIQKNKTLAPNKWYPSVQSIDKEYRDKAWEELRKDKIVSREGDFLVNAFKGIEYRKFIRIDNIMVSEMYDNPQTIEETWAMIIGQGIVKSGTLKQAIEKIIRDADKADNEKEIPMPLN